MKRYLFLFLILFSFYGFSQKTVSLQVLTNKYLGVEFENKFKNNDRMAYKIYAYSKTKNRNTNFSDQYFGSNHFNIEPFRKTFVEAGVKRYYTGFSEQKWLNAFIAGGITFGQLKRELINIADIPNLTKNELTQNVLFTGAQFTLGVKTIIKKRIVVSTEFGGKKLFKLKTNNEQLTKNVEFWNAHNFTSDPDEWEKIRGRTLNDDLQGTPIARIMIGYQF